MNITNPFDRPGTGRRRFGLFKHNSRANLLETKPIDEYPGGAEIKDIPFRKRTAPALRQNPLPMEQTAMPVQKPQESSQPVQPSPSKRTLNVDAFAVVPPRVRTLQQKGYDENDLLEPLQEEDLEPGSFDLVVAAPAPGTGKYSIETRSELLFSSDHLQVIFEDPSLLLRFSAFLAAHRPSSLPMLVYYLDAVKALKAIRYSNAVAEALEPIESFDFTRSAPTSTANQALEEKIKQSFEQMVREDLPAYITHTYIQTVSLSIQKRITGTLPATLREASEGLAEVFCLTDPSRPDNPIVFSSEEFHRTTQYGLDYVLGRNCRFLQGPKTNPFSVRRIREKIEAGKEHCEVFLNYRRDGSPFMNLLMCAPLCDSRGMIRYFIGAQVDVSGLVKECADLESLRQLVQKTERATQGQVDEEVTVEKDEFRELSEMFNLAELDTVRRFGGRMHKESYEEKDDGSRSVANWNKPRLVIGSLTPDGQKGFFRDLKGQLGGIYENYLLIRPYPSLRILFASPSLRVPGILQSPFMNKIGGSARVRDELTQAFADGRGVTAKVRWVSKQDEEGRSRWIHCTPLIGTTGDIGVWMIILVDDEDPGQRRFRQAPPVDPKFGRTTPVPFRNEGRHEGGENSSELDLAMEHQRETESLRSYGANTERSGSPYTLRID
ncbi:hypothetical protein B0O99DRAFT_651885 [Bisporella sp. PMI_857]|nr:hypothetical protein B0O99DRAFT_651885 [Bisporella sp. PMI_857]